MDAGGVSEPVVGDKVFLQLLLAAGWITESRFAARVAELNRKLPISARREPDAILSRASSVLGALGFRVVRARDDFSGGERVVGVVTRDPVPAVVARRYVAQHHAVQLKSMLELMFANARCEGLHPRRDLPARDFPARDEIVQQMTTDGWFETVDGRVYISTRLLYEDEPWLVDSFGGSTLLPCIGCHEWLLKGVLCTNDACPARLHTRCYEAYFQSTAQTRGICPTCGSAFQDFEEEVALETASQAHVASPSVVGLAGVQETPQVSTES